MNLTKTGADSPCFDPTKLRIQRLQEKVAQLADKLQKAAHLGALAVSQTYDVQEMASALRKFQLICDKFGSETLSVDERALISVYDMRLDRYLLSAQSRVDEVLRYDKTGLLSQASKQWDAEAADSAKGQALADQMPTT